MITGQLKSEIDRLWETFWTGGIANPITVIEQITYLIFMRRLDEMQTLKEKQANMLGTAVKDPIYLPEERELRWSSLRHMDPELMFEVMRLPKVADKSAFDFMKTMGGAGSAFGTYMKDATFMIPTARLLDKAVQLIDKIDMSDRDTKGDLYEYLLSKIASAGQNGQFRTPRHIIEMMVALMEPTVTDRICDPSAGTAGFLVAAGEYMRAQHPEAFHDKAFLQHFNSDFINGIEFDATMIRIGAMNLMLHGIEQPHLLFRDALSEANSEIRDRYTLILANPPFKGSLDYDAVDKSVLSIVKSKKTELLFLGLMLRMLRPGGRAAVIVPDGVLFRSGGDYKTLREEIIERHRLEGIISMPSGVFKPYAGVGTAVLIFTKTGSGGTDKVWFYDMQADGYSLDDKRQAQELNDIPDILRRWKERDTAESESGRNTKCFYVPKAEIVAQGYDLSINRYKKVDYAEVSYDSPAVILGRITEIDAERKATMEILRGMIG